MIRFENISKSYSGKAVLDNLSLTLPEGRITVITGESGCGKTTLLNIAAGLVKPDSGGFICDKKIAYMFQEPRLLPGFSALKNICAVLRCENKEAIAKKYLDLVELSDSSEKLPGELSGGMAQRLSLARFLAYAEVEKCELWLLDEPTSALDKDLSARILSRLAALAEGKTVIVVTHDEGLLDGVNRIKM